MRFKDYFTNDFETEENHYLPELRTRYYRCNLDAAKNAISELIKNEKAVLKDVVDTYNEYFIQGQNYTCIITLTSTRVSETAIDIKITTYKVIPRGLGKKIIERMYKFFDSKLPFKGVSLYRE